MVKYETFLEILEENDIKANLLGQDPSFSE